MSPELKTVSDWMETFGQEVNTIPTIPTDEVIAMRARLELEECLEKIVKGLGCSLSIEDEHGRSIFIGESFLKKKNTLRLQVWLDNKPCFSEILDADADQTFVSKGTLAAFGLTRDDEAWTEVCRSNFSKLWKLEQLKETADKNQGWHFTSVNDGKFVVTDETGKVMKPPTYSPADCGKFVG